MVRRSALIAAALTLLGAAPPGAEGPQADAPVEPAQEAAARAVPPVRPGGTSWFALPVLFWLPETRLGYGATGGLHFHFRGAERASSVFVVGAYTLNQQGSADVAGDVNLRNGVLVAGRVRLVHFPDAFYGIGPDTPTGARESYTRRWFQAIVDSEVPVFTRKLRAGPRLDVRAEEMRDAAPGPIASGTVEGARGFAAVGFGGTVTWDTRDRPLFPLRGSFAQAWFLHYPGAVGHRHGEFSVGNVEGRTFLPLGGERVLGVAAFAEQTSGAVPFTLLPKLGSSTYLRGWREGRFRDRAAWAAQAELRLPVVERVYATAFGAFGDVGADLGSFRAETLKVAGGVGLRYRLTPEGANIRLDVAESKAGTEVYLIILDAF